MRSEIPVKNRFSHHQSKSTIDFPFLNMAITQGIGGNAQHFKIDELSGGFMNSNFKIYSAHFERLMRVYSSGKITAERERDLLQYAKRHGIKVPSFYKMIEVEGKFVSFLEYINAQTLEDSLLQKYSAAQDFYQNLGSELAKIHQIRIDAPGFIGPKMISGREYQNFSHFIKSFILKTLDQLSVKKLSESENKRFRKLVQDKWFLVDQIDENHSLCHTDFNPKNILVSRGAKFNLEAIIDWEFCIAGNGLIDIGNFFRFDFDYPIEAKEQFISGYTKIRPLPDNWEVVAKLLDLGNMCSFLERPEDYQESFRTARAVIYDTLDFFGY